MQNINPPKQGMIKNKIPLIGGVIISEIKNELTLT